MLVARLPILVSTLTAQLTNYSQFLSNLSRVASSLFALAASFALFTSSTMAAQFSKVTLTKEQLRQLQDPKLCSQAQNTQDYRQRHKQLLSKTGYGLPSEFSVENIDKTLTFICLVQQQDNENLQTSRLRDPAFVNRHFDIFQWTGNPKQIEIALDKASRPAQQKRLKAIPDDAIMLTKYYVKKAKGSAQPKPPYTQALYMLPGSSAANSATQSSLIAPKDYRYTRQQILKGELADDFNAKPLVWVKEPDLHDILMQGTVVVDVNGEQQTFNVDRHNGIPYAYEKTSTEQGRYWYFKGTQSILGFGVNHHHKLAIEPQITVAADIQFLGLGTVMLLTNTPDQPPFSRIVMTGDTGGAFTNNQFQLDLLVGSYFGWQDYQQANKHLPTNVNTYVLILKPDEIQF